MKETDVESQFGINKDTFGEVKQIYEARDLTANYLIQFPIVLPFCIPFKEKTCLSLKISDDSICTFHFSNVLSEELVSQSIDQTKLAVRKTRVEMTYATETTVELSKDEEKSTEMLTNYFDILLSTLNEIIMSYYLYKKDLSVYQISREMLGLGTIFRIVKVNNWEETERGMFLLNFDVPYDKEELKTTDEIEICRHAIIVMNDLNPYILAEDIMINAKRNLKDGFYKEVVINSQSAIETFLQALLIQLLESEGKSTQEINHKLEETPFMKMVKREFHTRIGGIWIPGKLETAIGEWYKYTYLIRNNVVHRGVTPTSVEANCAVSAAISLMRYVIALLKSSQEKYPTISNFFAERRPVDQ